MMNTRKAVQIVTKALRDTEYSGEIQPEYFTENFGATYTRIDLERPGATIFVRDDGTIYDPFNVLGRWRKKKF